MQLHIAKRGFTGHAQGPLRTGDCRESQSTQPADPIDTPVAPLHFAIQRIILLLDKAVYATIERVSHVAGVPAVAIIPPSGFPNGVHPVLEPGSVCCGIACAVLVCE